MDVRKQCANVSSDITQEQTPNYKVAHTGPLRKPCSTLLEKANNCKTKSAAP